MRENEYARKYPNLRVRAMYQMKIRGPVLHNSKYLYVYVSQNEMDQGAQK